MFQEEGVAGVGQQLQDRAEWLAAEIAAADAQYQTVIHGDYKTANIMFERGTSVRCVMCIAMFVRVSMVYVVLRGAVQC